MKLIPRIRLLTPVAAAWIVASLASIPLLAQNGPLPEPGQRVVLVTGSTSGLGREVARSLAAEGDHVILHGRSEARGMELLKEINDAGVGSARFYPADFASLNQVRELASSIRGDYDRLDVLVNNAGVLMQELRMSEDGNELTFQVNYLAPYLLTEELLPLIQRSAPARIVNVSSLASNPFDWGDPQGLGSPFDGSAAYGRSKHAQVMHTFDLAARLDGTGVQVNTLHPETFMDTNMILSMGLEPRSSVLTGRDNVLQLIQDEVGSGDYYRDGEPTRAPGPQAYDTQARARLRALSERLVAPVQDQLDAYWAEVSRTVAEGDFQGYSVLYHPDAVLVTAQGSMPISAALDGWEAGFLETAAGRTTASVDFRLTERRLGGSTAHETGMFHYQGGPVGGEPSGDVIHFEALLVKRGDRWLMTMEYQKSPATMAQWEAAGGG